MKDTSFDQLKRFLSFFWETEIIGYIPQFLSFLQLCSYWKEIFWTLWKMFILCSSSIVVVVLCMLFFKNLVEFSWNIFIFSFISMTVSFISITSQIISIPTCIPTSPGFLVQLMKKEKVNWWGQFFSVWPI